eukprot:TRINITY_DN19845_c0_g1_i2.p1 TRINITY_DN19845_c0_g1~~TRINITY_DN19845_c0_g1_i2.p1  ORF type:complete len:297 (+),score=40.34 TRINITY_DN19845_c0_g1_i2:553-1443(+)
MFFEGFPGSLNMRSSADELCSTSPCLMVADAVRLSRLSDTCDRSRLRLAGHGSISLEVAWTQDTGNAEEVLQQHMRLFEASLASSCDYAEVSITDIRLMGRNYFAPAARRSTMVQMQFVFTVVTAPNSTSRCQSLPHWFNTALQEAKAPFKVVSAKVEKKHRHTKAVLGDSLLVHAALIAMTGLTLGFFIRYLKQRCAGFLATRFQVDSPQTGIASGVTRGRDTSVLPSPKGVPYEPDPEASPAGFPQHEDEVGMRGVSKEASSTSTASRSTVATVTAETITPTTSHADAVEYLEI